MDSNGTQGPKGGVNKAAANARPKSAAKRTKLAANMEVEPGGGEQEEVVVREPSSPDVAMEMPQNVSTNAKLWIPVTEDEVLGESDLQKGDFVSPQKFKALTGRDYVDSTEKRGVLIELENGRFVPESGDNTVYDKNPTTRLQNSTAVIDELGLTKVEQNRRTPETGEAVSYETPSGTRFSNFKVDNPGRAGELNTDMVVKKGNDVLFSRSAKDYQTLVQINEEYGRENVMLQTKGLRYVSQDHVQKQFDNGFSNLDPDNTFNKMRGQSALVSDDETTLPKALVRDGDKFIELSMYKENNPGKTVNPQSMLIRSPSARGYYTPATYQNLKSSNDLFDSKVAGEVGLDPNKSYYPERLSSSPPVMVRIDDGVFVDAKKAMEGAAKTKPDGTPMFVNDVYEREDIFVQTRSAKKFDTNGNFKHTGNFTNLDSFTRSQSPPVIEDRYRGLGNVDMAKTSQPEFTHLKLTSDDLTRSNMPDRSGERDRQVSMQM